MGADFSSHWIRTAETKNRDVVFDAIRVAMRADGLSEIAEEAHADRSFVVGPERTWTFIGDTTGSTESANATAFDSLSRALSDAVGPVVDIKMSDQAAVHFYLYRQGRLVDKFGNLAFPFYEFKREEATEFRGRPELWADLLLSPDSVDTLRSAWQGGQDANYLLMTTGELLGLDDGLLSIGYTYDDEGIAIKYDEILPESEIDLSAFQELHFRRASRST